MGTPHYSRLKYKNARGICKPKDNDETRNIATSSEDEDNDLDEDFRHTPFLIANIFIWFGTTIILSIILLIKVLNAPKSQFAKSKKRRMAELSVSLTTAAIVFSGLTAVIFMFLYLFFPWIASYLLIIKPLGADCPVVVPVWIFWRTMPAFRKRRSNAADKNARGAGGTVSVVNVSGAYRIGLVK
uniref:Serpentine receptor class gamma n=1 Tax=Caenorhabditis japonica TaxID=281687 RepID=A0A8R1EC05_CAEJA